ncbi:MAG: CopD family protein [Albidovulum sp.]|nr:CopD family protein [Albidovulum sp.]MDE0306681.1 CopD family protein [Albidovulum sp.]MDE0532672.1 CopD family protein [Albidovulum sp.]
MPDIWALATVAATFATYLGVLASTGLVLVRIAFAREIRLIHVSLVRQTTAFALLGLFASIIGFALTGAALTGDSSGLTDLEMLGLLSRTPVGSSVAVRLVGLALVLAGIWIPRFGLPIAAAGALLSAWSFTIVGHSTGAGQFWLGGVLLLHLAGVSFWVGILSPLREIAGKQEFLSEAAGLGRRFGQVARFTVPGLIAAGVYLAWSLLGDFASLATTSYGLALLAKIGLVACLLAAAAANKFRFVPAMEKEDCKAAVRLRQSIVVEWVAVCLIILATAVLTTVTTPPA